MKTLGYTRRRHPVTLTKTERSLHFHLVGGSGSGKSTALDRWFRQIASGPEGAMLIDPHGTLYDALLAWAGRHGLDRHKRIHLIEPRLTEYCPAFNPLAIPRDALETGVSSVVHAFAQVWGGEDVQAHPRLTRLLRDIIYVLAEHGLTLAEAKLLLAPEQKRLRAQLTLKLPNEYFRGEWSSLRTLIEANPKSWMEFSESTDNRLAPFLSSPVVRRIVGQAERTLDLADAMARGDLVLVNLRTSPQFSEEDSRLLGTLLLNDVRLRAFQRPRGARPFFVFVDECYKFLNSDVESMLTETRKFGVHMVLAHQNLGQLRALGDAIYETVMAIPNKCIFGRLSHDDARLIADEIFCGEFDLETPKKSHTMPVTVGYRPVWLESMATARSHADFDSEGTADGDSESSTSPAEIETDADEKSIQVTAGRSRNANRSRGASDTSSESEGMTESREAILEERPTQLYSLEELKYQATVLLKNLKPGIAIAKIDGRKTEHITIPLPRKGLPLQSSEFTSWKHRLLRGSRHVAAPEKAEAEIAGRTTRLLGKGGATQPLDVNTEIELSPPPRKETSHGRRRTSEY